jgi:hypothetical protein
LGECSVDKHALVEDSLSMTPNWQFHVFFAGPFVLKFPKSIVKTEMAIRHSRWGHLDASAIAKLATEVTSNARASLNLVWRLPEAHPLCGHPQPLPLRGFAQLRGLPFLDTYRREPSRARAIIDDYFDLTIGLWRHGLFEMSFDFLRNCGYLSSGHPFQIDLGDFTDDLERASIIVRQERWVQRLDFACLPPSDQAYYAELASRHFTIEALTAAWGRRS